MCSVSWVCVLGCSAYPALCNPMHFSPPGLGYIGLSQQEYWSGLPFPAPKDLPHSGTEPASLCLLHWQAESLPLSHLGNPLTPHMLNKWPQIGICV